MTPRARLVRGVIERAALVGLSLVLLGAVEGGLRLAGYGHDDGGALDFGIDAQGPVFVPDARDPHTMVVAPWLERMTTRKGRRVVNEERFPARRPDGELRIVAVGDSTVFGYPLGGPDAFPYRIGELVQRAHPEAKVRAIDAGVSGFDARRVASVVSEVLQYEPDLVVVYTGHNEYLRRFAVEHLQHFGWRARLGSRLASLRLYQLLGRLLHPLAARVAPSRRGDEDKPLATEDMLERPRTPDETALVEARYEEMLRRMCAAARAADVPLVLCTPASNVRWFPEHTVHVPGTTDETVRQLAGLRRRIVSELGGDVVAAEADARKALTIEPGHASYHHFLAAALEKQGRLDEALREYAAARDLESSPNRAGTSINAIVRNVAASEHVLLADVERAFLSDTGHGLWGETYFTDHCHPDAEGHELIARVVVEAAASDLDARLVRRAGPAR